MFWFWEWTGRFQTRWTGNWDGGPTDIIRLFEFCREASLEVGTFVLLEIGCQEEETDDG